MYYEALDLVVEGIKDRFNQLGYSVLQHLEELLLKVCKGETTAVELDYVCTVYGNDIDRQELECQLPMLHELVKQALESPDCDRELSIRFMVQVLSDLSSAQRMAFSQVFVVTNLLLVLHATSERFFSALRRVKTYLRSTMTQKRLNNLMIIIYKAEVNLLDLEAVVNEFVSVKDSRSNIFGTF